MKLKFLLLLLLTGCGPKEGRVVSREFIPQHEITYLSCTIDGDGDIDCDTETMTIPDQWQVTVTLDDTNCGTWSATKWDYDHATNGAWFQRGKGIIPVPSVEK